MVNEMDRISHLHLTKAKIWLADPILAQVNSIYIFGHS